VNLPAALFDEITGLGDLPTPVTDTDFERRSHHRFAIGSRATICTLRKGVEGSSSIVLMRDISLAGVGFLHNEMMRAGDTFIIRFAGKSGAHVRIRCVVNRCEPGGTGGMQFVIGATFEVLLEIKDAEPKKNDDKKGVKIPRPQESASESQSERPLIARPAPSADTANYASNVMGVTLGAAKKIQETAASAQASTTTAAAAIEQLTEADSIEHELHDGGANPDTVGRQSAAAGPAAADAAAAVQEENHKVTIAERLARSAPAEPSAIGVTAQSAVSAAPSPQAGDAEMLTKPTVAEMIDPDDAILPAKNQEILARVRNHLLSHGKTVHTQTQQLEEVYRQLNAQKATSAELVQERDALQAAVAAAQKRLAEAEQSHTKKLEQLEKELAALNQTIGLMQAKSEADDKAVAELALLMEALTGGENLAGASDIRGIGKNVSHPVNTSG
jgi:regulator of replication initiation timing